MKINVPESSAPVREKPKRSMKKKILIPVLSFGILAGLAGGGYLASNTLAYLSDRGPVKHNELTVGNVVMDITEDFEKPPAMDVGTTTFKKDVKITNNGTVTGFTRASILFSNGDVEGISEVSGDGGKTWYSLDEFSSHLPSGWAYQANGTLGGYYYYTKALAPGESTTSLITHVRTTFEEAVAVTDESINRTPRDYDIFVYAEGLQQEKLDGSGPWSDYSQAWSAFLAQKG